MDVPEIKSVEIAPAKPENSDERRLQHLQTAFNRVLDSVVYVVKIYLVHELPAAGSVFTLFVGRDRIPKYTQFSGGIYFKVHDPNFLEAHRGEPVWFSPETDALAEATTTDSPRIPFPANPTSSTMLANSILPDLNEVLAQ